MATMIGGRGPDQLVVTPAWSLADLFAVRPEDAEAALAALVHDALGLTVLPTATRIEPVDYAMGSPATGALLRVLGASVEGQPWGFFCKVLQHVRHWPTLPMLPEGFREMFARDFPWRQELVLWAEPFAPTAPAGMRPPAMHALIELPDDRVAVWTELVDECDEPWRPERFRRAARLLGQWNQRASKPEVLASAVIEMGSPLRLYATHTVPLRGLAPLADDDLWSHPWLAREAGLRASLRELGARVPAVMDRLDGLPQCIPHGDASPQNLLVPRDAPLEFRAIDVAFHASCPIGMDLGQLLVGLVHAGHLDPVTLPGLVELVVSAYVEGLLDEGWSGAATDVGVGFVGAMLVRSGFDSFRYDLLGAGDPPPEFTSRVELSRWIAEMAHQVF
ncbi:MAG: aminoglycoside phosphotransferase [Nocardioides sp.]|uniref:aminoglycoside phosphotransferase n=1 Tax=Nocardioides sp. TaxID=35761 RepID=UPI003266C937